MRAARLRLRDVLVGALVVLSLTACGDGEGGGTDQDTSSPSLGKVAWHQAGDGYVYLQVSTDGRHHYEVERIELSTGEAKVITTIPGPFGVSTFSVSQAGLFVAEAPEGSDQLARMTQTGDLAPVPPLDHSSSPEPNDRGDLLAFTVRGRQVRLVGRRAADRGWTLDMPIGDSDEVVWRDRRSFIVLHPESGDTQWRTVDLSGHVVRGAGTLDGRRWPASADPVGVPILLGGNKLQPAQLWWPGDKLTDVAAGWEGGCLSPDQKSVLLIGPAGRVGVASVARPGTVRALGHVTPGVISTCAWSRVRYG